MNMNKILKQAAIFIVVLGVAGLVGFDAFAEEAGSGLQEDFETAINGSLGTTIGLVVSLFGLYMWIWNQVTWGIVVAIAGALLTAFPGIYKSIGKFGEAAFDKSADINLNDSVKD